jgi:hypothetical protein
MGGIGAGMQAGGFDAAADAREQSAIFAANQMEARAKQAVAMKQRAAEEERRQSRIAQSNILARAAASGGGASDPTVVNLISRAAGEGACRAAVALYEGESEARLLRLEAQATRAAGRAEAEQLRTRATTTLLGGAVDIFKSAGSIYSRYSAGGPPTATAAFTPARLNAQAMRGV